ncbi:DUF429 domain-containing protein [Miltoncostaea oceani]|uniref:DUF429 domain-containing protein n=1 Tax=Miltoncostaea oceani TaxID=2843216 RepID=UPI001C3D3A44|nr:DUF429 domain-containing protein [Miltoncostaea oceani]
MPGPDDIVAAAARGRFGLVYRYGDLSMAVYGHRRGGQAIAQAARGNPSFACASHFVPNDWRLGEVFISSLGSGRQHWIERLRADGIPVGDDGLIPESHRGDWTDLAAEPPLAGPDGPDDEAPGWAGDLDLPVATLAPVAPTPVAHSAASSAMTFIGVDLAWGQNAGTGVCAVVNGQVVDSAQLKTDDQILEWLSPLTQGPCLVGIDAPLIVPNASKRRFCESVISRWMSSREAGAHSANSGLPSFVNGPRGAHLAAALGLDMDPDIAPGDLVRRAIEVYPHPAQVVLFDLPKTLKYKSSAGRTVESRRQAFAVLMDLIEGLAGASPPLQVAGPCWDELRAAIETATSGADLDRAEDEIDAYVCAYTALHHWTHGPAGSRIIGSLAQGYIVCPIARLNGEVDPGVVSSLDQAVHATIAKALAGK